MRLYVIGRYVAVLLCIGGGMQYTSAKETVRARLSQIVGQVEIRPEGMDTWRPAKVGMVLGERHTIRSFLESEAEVTFANGSVVKIAENSVVSLSRLQFNPASGSSKSTVSVGTGGVWANVKKLTNRNSEFEFETPTAVASIRGTRLGITVEKRQTLLDVYEGLVVIKKKKDRRVVNVPANTRAIVDIDSADIAVVSIKKDKAVKSVKTITSMPFDADGNKSVRNDGSSVPDSTVPDSQPERMMEDSLPSGENGGKSGGLLDENEVVTPSGKKLSLTVSAPVDGALIDVPLIAVTGITLPEAKIFVNDQQCPIDRYGAFQMRLPIPDEPYLYIIDIRAEYDGVSLSRQRSITYAPRRGKLFLECTTPSEGAVITGRSIHVTGKTSPGATVTANGTPLGVTGNGTFVSEIPVTEKNIGDYTLDIVTRNQENELSKTLNLEISGNSSLINTSVPIIVFPSQGRQAVIQNFITVQVLDPTPQDELSITVTRNGMTDVIMSSHGKTEKLFLDEGRNDYMVRVNDRADNKSPVVKGRIYYLPGPLKLILNEPSSNHTVYEGVPPVMHPGRSVADEPVDVEIEIDDGIGNVPESIRYCKVTGNGTTVLLRNNNDYIYTGTVNVQRGTNQFVVQVEDLSARLETLKFVIEVK